MSDPLTRSGPADPGATSGDRPAAGSTAAPPIGADRYALGEEIARGGMGVIYRATDTALSREVAVKVLQDQFAPDSGTARRFADEARITAQLQHPGIPPVHDLGTLPDGRPFLAMKLIKGQTLEELLSARPDPSAERGRFVAVFEAVCQALAYAHAHDVIHRDLKPANVMVGAFGEVQVMDWGLAKVLVAGPEETTDPVATRADTAVVSLRDSDGEVTQAGSVLGTPAFMPPEQAVGAVGKVDRRSDVFGLGAILAVILTGKPPFAASSAETTRVQAAQGKVDECFARLDQSRAEPEWVALCKHCLAPDKADRPNDAGEVVQSVAALRAAEEERARQAELERVRAVEQQKRRRVQLTLALSVIGLVAAAAFGVVLAIFWKQAEWAKETADLAKAAAEAAKENEQQARQSAEKSRGAAEAARDAEKLARQDAERAQGTAETARDAEEITRKKFEQSEYGRTIQVAFARWRGTDVADAVNLLDATRPELRGWEWDYLQRLCHSDLLTLKGHKEGVASASFSRDGTRILTVGWGERTASGYDGTVKVWDAKTGTEVLILALSRERNVVPSALFSPDGTRIVTTGGYKTAVVWDAKTGAPIRNLDGHFGPVYSASFSPDGARIVTASADETAKVWDAKSGTEVLTLGRGIVRMGHSDRVYSASFSPDGARIITTSGDKTAIVWDADTGGNILTLKGHKDPVFSASFSPDGTRIVTVSTDGTAKMWDAQTGTDIPIREKELLVGVRSVSFSPDGTRIVTARYDTTAKVLDAKTGTELLTLKGHTRPHVNSASFNPDGTLIVTASTDGTAKVWDAKTGIDTPTLKVTVDGVKNASFSPDGTRILTTSTDGTAKVWDAKTRTEIPILKGDLARVRLASFSPDGTRIVTASADGAAKVLDAKTGTEVLTLKDKDVLSASFSPDGTRILTVDNQGVVKGWHAKTGTYIGSLRGGSNGLASFSPDRTRIVTSPPKGSASGWATVWDAKTGTEIFTRNYHDHLYAVSFSPDGTRIVTAGSDGTAKVADANTGTEILTLKGHTASVLSASFSPDGTRIVTTSSDNTAKVWDAKTGIDTLTLTGHKDHVNSAAFSADGTRIVTASADGTAKIWDARPLHPDR